MKKIGCIITSLLIISLSLASCTSNSGSQATAEKTETTESVLPDKVVIGMTNTFAPFVYVDEDGNPAGYDYEVAKEAFKRLGIETDFEPVPWESLLSGLQAGKFDVAISSMFATKERIETYNFSSFPYFRSSCCLAMNNKYGNVDSLDKITSDMVMAEMPGDINIQTLEDYNAKHNNVIQITYYDDTVTLVNDIANGRVAGTLYDSVSIHQVVDANNLGDKVTINEVDYNTDYARAAFQKNDKGEALCNAFSEECRKMYEDGTLATLCTEEIGNSRYVEGLDAGELAH